MQIRGIQSLYFSPTGGTAKYAKAMAAGAAEALACPAEVSSFTLPREREDVRHFSSDELLIIGSPTYAGKLPNKILPEFQEKLRGEHTPVLLFVSYGNRNFDNSLAELLSVLRTNGFLPLAAAAFACRHAFSDRICPERPRVEELAEARSFAMRAAEALKAADLAVLEEASLAFTVPGDAEAPYYVPKGEDGAPAKFLKAKPLTDLSKCLHCGACAAHCPMGSIDAADTSNVPGICIKCQACVRGCKQGAKYFEDAAFLSHVRMLEQNFAAPEKENLYLSAF
jgi:putative ferredoxin